jgi:hypothetical protein
MDREERRRLAEYHQQRQLRLERTLSWTRRQKYDPDRKVQSQRGKKARFLAHLYGKVYEPAWVGLWYIQEPDLKRIGRLRKVSWDDCGRSKCRSCGNPRHSGWYKYREQVTMQERRADYTFSEECD